MGKREQVPAHPPVTRHRPAQPTSDSPVRLVLDTPLYRGATVALFLSGVGFSAAAPQIARFLVTDLGGSLTVAGLFYLTNLTAPIAGYLIGARSDRTGQRLGLFRVCAVAGFLGWTGIAFSTQLWMPFVISTVVLSFAAAATSQLFAAIHDEAHRHPGRHTDGVVAIVRMALTAGWVVGPVAGSFLAAQFGFRTMLTATGLCVVAQILPLGTLRTPLPTTTATHPGSTTTANPRPPIAAMLPLLAFTSLYVLVYAGEPIKYAYLPIHMNRELQLDPALSGTIIGIQPLVELLLMPLAIVVARRTGAMRLLTAAAALGVAANICFATAGTATGLIIGQTLMGAVWAIFMTLGILVAQRLLPTAVATASAIFLSSSALSSALGGLGGGLGVAVAGLPHVFFLPAALALVAAAGLAAMIRSTSRVL